MSLLSVIICTHNPRQDYLRRTLEALKAQVHPVNEWELVLIDNASKEPQASHWDLSWHPQSRHVREEELGLTAARLRGIRESRGELLVFVDDDNLLAPDYLQQAVRIAERFPYLGTWGARIEPEFEIEPPGWTQRFWSYLALRPLRRSFWANIVTDYSILPCGAGLCVRREVVEAYIKKLSDDPSGREFGRKGSSLVSCEDIDISLTACDLGFGYGNFTELQLLHLIPRGRLQEEYLLRLEQGIAFSSALLLARRNGPPPSAAPSALRCWLGTVRRRIMMDRLDRLVMEARLRGCHQAHTAFREG